MIVGWFGRYNHPCMRRIVLALYSFLHVADTLSRRQAFIGCLKVLCCTSGKESGLSCTSRISNGLGCDIGDDGNSLDCVLSVGNSLELAFLVQLSLMMPGRSLCWNLELTCPVDNLV